MASAIDITKPTATNPTTASVRDNFAAAKAEIEDLQGVASVRFKRKITEQSINAINFTEITDFTIDVPAQTWLHISCRIWFKLPSTQTGYAFTIKSTNEPITRLRQWAYQSVANNSYSSGLFTHAIVLNNTDMNVLTTSIQANEPTLFSMQCDILTGAQSDTIKIYGLTEVLNSTLTILPGSSITYF